MNKSELRRHYKAVRAGIQGKVEKTSLIQSNIQKFLNVILSEAEESELSSGHTSDINRRSLDCTPLTLHSAQDDIIASYFAVHDEADILPALANHKIALPYIAKPDTPLIFKEYNGATQVGAYNIPTATGNIVTPNIVFTPLLAFTKQGHRLGYGGGFYDRTLTSKMLKIGIAFADQEAETLPNEPHDINLDYIITENGVMRCHDFIPGN